MPFKPNQALLDNWKLWIAKEVVEQWQNKPLEYLKLSSVKNALDLTNNNTEAALTQRLRLEIEQSQQSAASIENFQEVVAYLEDYYSNEIIAELQQIGRSLRSGAIETLKSLASTDSGQAAPKKLMLFFKSLSTTLSEQKNDYKQQKIQYTNQSTSAWQAFLKLSNMLNDTRENSLEYLSIKQSVNNALVIYFVAKLNIEIGTLKSQITTNLIELCRSYYNSAYRSRKMLNQIYSSLKQKCSVDLISIPVFTSLRKIDPDYQRRLLETWVGYSLNYWRNSEIPTSEIEAKLLENVEPIARRLYEDFYHCFIEHSVTEDPE